VRDYASGLSPLDPSIRGTSVYLTASVTGKATTGRELPELANEVVLGTGDDKHSAVLRADK
jgi:hypothetical protein